MKKLLVIMAVLSAALGSCKKETTTVTGISDQEKLDLIFLREEEKLARDVYIFSFNKYAEDIFSNISNSEQSHMNAVLALLNKYNVADPASPDVIGVFQNADLQDLYNQLTAISDSSLTHALTVGATIEDLDIHDIDDFISNTNNASILDTYDKLSCGSGNHLRSFVSVLGSYNPSYLSLDEYNGIISSENEQCGN